MFANQYCPCYICIPLNSKCPDGGIGRRAGLKHLWETVPVRLRLWVRKKPSMKIEGFFVDNQLGTKKSQREK